MTYRLRDEINAARLAGYISGEEAAEMHKQLHDIEERLDEVKP